MTSLVSFVKFQRLNKKSPSLVCLLVSALVCLGFSPSLSQVPLQLKDNQQASWNELTPLKSTRSDVERLFGKAKNVTGRIHLYQNATERIDVWYAVGRCGLGADEWTTPKDTVVRFNVVPLQSKAVRDLSLDRTKFVRTQWHHPKDFVTYKNLSNGIAVEALGDSPETEYLRYVSYFPSRELSKEMLCK